MPIYNKKSKPETNVTDSSEWHNKRPLTLRLSFYDFRFYCVEQYMHAAKALIFNDVNTFVQIMESKLPSEAKKLGRQVSP
jgi:predicted NAD-dependent protein-ADP-ribosyltransferase YbiA (DUF1768 family)